MTGEAVITTLMGMNGDPVEYDVAQAGSIMKGTLMMLSASPQTASGASANGEFFVGIAATEKEAGSGTKMACITNCVAQILAGTGTSTVGLPQKITGVNAVVNADDDTVAKAAEVVGVALEEIADGEFGAVRVNL